MYLENKDKDEFFFFGRKVSRAPGGERGAPGNLCSTRKKKMVCYQSKNVILFIV
jgi:hypothetical protein